MNKSIVSYYALPHDHCDCFIRVTALLEYLNFLKGVYLLPCAPHWIRPCNVPNITHVVILIMFGFATMLHTELSNKFSILKYFVIL